MRNRRDLLLETLLEPVFIASNYVADDGRPLAEITATNNAKKGVNFELRRCPYSGSRFEKEMNVSALPGLSQQIALVMSDTIKLRNAYLNKIGECEFSLLSFWRFTRILDSMPVFMVRKSPPLATEDLLPARVSAMFKAAQGLHLAPEVMLLRGDNFNAKVTTQGLLDVIENSGLYLDGSRACAGPPKMIEAFVISAVEGKGKVLDDDWLEDVDNGKFIENLFEYSDAVTTVFATKILFEAESRLGVNKMLADFQDTFLSKECENMLGRFGSLRGRDNETLNKICVSFQSICQLSNIKAQYQLQNIERFQKMLTLRNPRLLSRRAKLAADYLITYLLEEREWFKVFEQRQASVLNALGISQQAPVFTSNDFSGYGYNLRDVLSSWLRVDILNLADKIVLIGGATREEFSLKRVVQ